MRTFSLDNDSDTKIKQEVGQLQIGDKKNRNLMGQVAIGNPGSELRRR